MAYNMSEILLTISTEIPVFGIDSPWSIQARSFGRFSGPNYITHCLFTGIIKMYPTFATHYKFILDIFRI